ncbi:MAG: hypothetical protein AAB803_03015 [Patescibacteria group bacterium]
MAGKKKVNLEKRIERRFKELKRRDEIKQRYGVFTQKMLEDLFKKTLDEKLAIIQERLNKIDTLDEKLDWLMGKYQAHDEEHTLLNGKVSDHSDRLEVIEEKLSITAS